jgi:hypothetical protein
MTKHQPRLPKSEIIKEIIACSDDPIYFISKYCKTQHQVRGLVPFALYDYQKEAIKAYLANRFVICNKARQLGYTSLTSAFVAWLILFHKDKKVLCVSINAVVSKEIIEKIGVILNNIPEWMYLADFTTNSKHKIALSNGSAVESVARSDHAGRGRALSLLVIDEAAIISKMDELWKSLKSTVSTGGKIIAMSTPKGIGNWFHKTYSEARMGVNNWFPILTNWWECPDYAEDIEDDPNTPGGKTSTWFRNFVKDMTPLQIRQELLTEFLETGDTYFDSATLKHCDSQQRKPIRIEGANKELWVWSEPQPGHTYLISADCATGAGEDFSTAHVIDLRTLEVAAEYRAKVFPDLFADYLMELGKRYNEAWLAPESANIGSVTCFNIKNAGYKNLVFLDKDFKLIDRWQAENKGVLPGIPSDVRNRNAMVAKVEENLRKQFIKVYSSRLLFEMHTFALINGKAQASKNCHDDLIMALAIGCWLIDIIPQFGAKYNQVDNLFAHIKVSTTTYNNQKMTAAQKAHELRQKLERQGHTYASFDKFPSIFRR